ncbi:hypothetical protein Pint_33127 [Pistacia integerrima]|uniref:Uncharacterized protein n=1 Tax=Pistacia integerrima TaxID=434235 RepID=A0ACC0X829_9ROSI|nr:hypothetical protein Pint_33127 [Pistacia integerrima]
MNLLYLSNCNSISICADQDLSHIKRELKIIAPRRIGVNKLQPLSIRRVSIILLFNGICILCWLHSTHVLLFS